MSLKHVYNVYGALAKGARGNDQPYRSNRSIVVIAPDVPTAIKAVLEKYPDLEIDNIKHSGARELIICEDKK